MLKKYLLVTRNSLTELFTYRLNFVLWRVRVIVSILITYFLWQAIYGDKQVIFNYSLDKMLTYIILLSFINGVVLSTQTFRVAEEINSGKLSNYLVKPLNYFYYNFFRDLADKIINTVFAVAEIILLILVFDPPFFWQTNPGNLILFIAAVFLAALLYFEINLILSMIGFWSKEVWAPRFIFFIVVSFLAGTYFPLDIIPGIYYQIISLLPFAYLVFFPLKIYLGQVNLNYILQGIAVSLIWILVLNYLVKIIWRKGLKIYTAEGQ